MASDIEAGPDGMPSWAGLLQELVLKSIKRRDDEKSVGRPSPYSGAVFNNFNNSGDPVLTAAFNIPLFVGCGLKTQQAVFY